jgi:hypothetical protein
MKTNSLIYKTSKIAPNGEQWDISIRLNDKCKNGHQDFAITGDSYEKGKPKIDKYMVHGGACGDKIAKLWPEFEIFNQLHLCDCKGIPMYAVENGRYHFQNSSFEVAKDYLRLTDAEAQHLFSGIDDKLYFAYLLENLGILGRWESEANEAIKILEGLTGNEFIDDSKRYQYEPLTDEQRTEVERKIKDGYYLPEAIAKRKQAAKKEAKEKLISELRDKASKEIREMQFKLKLDMYIINFGFPQFSYIFYTHTKELVFNWSSTKITQKQFEAFDKSFKKTTMYKNAEVLKVSCK